MAIDRTRTTTPDVQFNVIDLFAGVGGFTLGFRGIVADGNCEFVPKLMVDIDRSACQAAVRNMPDVRVLAADVHTLSGAEIRKRSGLAPEAHVHVLLGGPPCQGFSFLGKRSLSDPRNLHVVDFLRIVKEIRPLVAVMENVPLIVTSHDGAVIREVCEGLSKLGYASCAEILCANEFGVPQIRKRAFVLAYRSDMGVSPELPKRTHERIINASDLTDGGKRVRFEADKTPFVSVEEAIGDLPPLCAGEGEDVVPYTGSATSEYQRRAREGSIAVFNHRSRSHSPSFLKKIAVISEGSSNQNLPDDLRFSDNYFSQAYARLHRNGLANTITTSFGNPGSGRFMHYRDLRSISVREAARLQSFPDTFVFDGDFTTQMRHVGNAVPPLLARGIRNGIAMDLCEFTAAQAGRSGESRPRRVETSEERSRVMRSVPSKDTSAELLLRKALRSAGMRAFRTHSARVPGTPDLVFTRPKVAVFVDGCFWHGCPKCYREPSTNKTYWKMKVRRNRDRDAKVSAECRKSGWRVVRLWEHEILKTPARAATKVIKEVEKRRARCR